MDLILQQEFLQQAKDLHEAYPVIDAHLDLAGEIVLRYAHGETEVIRNHYLTDFRTAKLNLVVSSIYIENKVPKEQQWETALEQIQALKTDLETVKEDCILVRTRAELDAVMEKKDKTGILLYMEGLDCIGEDISRLQTLYDLGVRGASLTWSRPNALANGCCKARERIQIPGGLTGKGIEAVKEMERLGMFLDISHLNDDGFEDICRITTKPFIATHSCAKEIYPSFRNLTDDQMRKLADQGGVMGLNGCSCIAGSWDNKEHLEMLSKQVLYEASKIGASHIGYGFDLCDSYDRAGNPEHPGESDNCIPTHGDIPLVTAALLQKGLSKQDVIGVMGTNFAQFFRNCLK